MYIPRPWHQILPFSMIMSGLYIGHNLRPATYDVILACISIYIAALMLGYYIMQAGIIYQRYLAQIDNAANVKPVAPKADEPKTYPNLRPVFESSVSIPRFDKERHWAVLLIRTHESFPDQVDLTELKWVIQKKMFIRAEFANMLKNWEMHGLIGRKNLNKNSPYIVTRWDGIRLIANGNPLPPPPPR